jgi:hypothetical protein
MPDIETGGDSWRSLLNIRDLNWGVARWRLGHCQVISNCGDWPCDGQGTPITQILAAAKKIDDNAKTYIELKALRRWAQAMRLY